MFWTEVTAQKMLFGSDEYQAPETISQLIQFAADNFPENDCNFHRRFAFLTHKASQQFLAPLIKREYGSLDAGKIPTLEWLEEIGSLETFARSTRAKDSEARPASLKIKDVPKWYRMYCDSTHYAEMKSRAESLWVQFMLSLTCSVNSRHPYEVLHHSDYGRLGEADEFRCLVPLCNGCHSSISARGPRLPQQIPEGVKRWI